MPDDGAVACGPAHGGVHGLCGKPPHPTIAFKAVIAYHAVSVRSFHGKRRFVDLDLLRRICRLIPRLIEPYFWWRLLAELAIEFWGRRGRGGKNTMRRVSIRTVRCAESGGKRTVSMLLHTVLDFPTWTQEPSHAET